MARISALLLAVAVLFGAVEVMAADKDIRTCALSRAIECVPDEGCMEWTIQQMELPRFVRIDLKAKTITSLDKEVHRVTKIATVERLKGLVVLHGTELRGWNLTMAEESGDFTLTAAGDDEGFIVFGSCMNP
jgi:hypothetical protein